MRWAMISPRSPAYRRDCSTVYNPIVDQEPKSPVVLAEADGWAGSLPASQPVGFGVGRLAKQKDFETLVRAFARVRHHRRARLLILGAAKNTSSNAVAEADLMSLAHALGVAEDVSLPGFRINPFSYMSRARVFVLSSRYEGLPAVLAQAMACGCPVVSTDCPTGPREILGNGRFGPLVPVGDPQAMAEAIGAVTDHPLSPAVLRARAAQFSVAASVENYLRLIEELIPGPRALDELRVEATSAACMPGIRPMVSPAVDRMERPSSGAPGTESDVSHPGYRPFPKSADQSSTAGAPVKSAIDPPSMLYDPAVGKFRHGQER